MANPFKQYAREYKNMASELFVKAKAGDVEALEMLRDAVLEAATLFESAVPLE